MRRSAKFYASLLYAAFCLAVVAKAQLPQPAGSPGKSLQNMIPTPVGQSSRVVAFPFWEDGKLKMFFNVELMYRKDLGHLEMTNAKIETYDDSGRPDMTVLLPVSTLDLNTRMVTSSQPFLVRQPDFSLVGQTLQLDTAARTGKVIGKVKMLIFNLEDANPQGH